MANATYTFNNACAQCGKPIRIRRLCKTCSTANYRKLNPDKVAEYRTRELEKRRLRIRPPRNCVDCFAVLGDRQRKRCAPCAASYNKVATSATARKKAEDNHLIKSRQCVECDTHFTTGYGDKRRLFCSEDCSKRSAKRVARKKERARLRVQTVEAVNPTRVFDRDGWLCHLCGKKTLKTKRGLCHPRSPELDHIIPLSKGGEHSYANTACSCRACNGAKGNKVIGQPSLLLC